MILTLGGGRRGRGGEGGGRGVLPLCRELKVCVFDLMRFIEALEGWVFCTLVLKRTCTYASV